MNHTTKSKVCKKCNTEKPIDQFYYHGAAKRIGSKCKACIEIEDKINNSEAVLSKLRTCKICKETKQVRDYLKSAKCELNRRRLKWYEDKISQGMKKPFSNTIIRYVLLVSALDGFQTFSIDYDRTKNGFSVV